MNCPIIDDVPEVDDSHILDIMEDYSFRPATFRELLAFLGTEEMSHDYPIAAIGSVFKNPLGISHIAIAWSKVDNSIILDISSSTLWPRNFHFLGIRK